MDFAYDMAKGNNFYSKGVFMINPLFSVPTFNLFGVDPFDHGESNVANGFTQLVNDLSSMIDTPTPNADALKFRRPNGRAERTPEVDTFWLELPGCKKEDLDITYEGDVITVVAKRVVGQKETTFKTPIVTDKDVANAKLNYEDGLLTITVYPKAKKEPEVKKLEVR
jgi:HSP20 family molecular chaperone IbpA